MFILTATKWIQDLLSIHESDSWDTEFHLSILGFVWPVVSSLVALAEWLTDMRSILTFFDIVKLILHSAKILGLDDFLNML